MSRAGDPEGPELRRLAAWAYRRLCLPADLAQFSALAAPDFLRYRHCQVLAGVLERVARGELTRVMVFMPPRHGKSRLVSRIFPAYYLLRNPGRWVGAASYAAELSYTFSREARANFLAAGGSLSPAATSVKHWETAQGGGMWAAGVGGPITGKGFHLGIIDDPLKNAAEAWSARVRQSQKDWFQSTFYTRQEPGGALVLIMTRWHQDDLAGWLLAQEEKGVPEGWHLVAFPALAEPGTPSYPPSCGLEPDWREPGQPLCPERYNQDKLERLMARVGDYYAQALYQARPPSSLGKGRVYRNFGPANLALVKDHGGPLLVGMDFNVDPMSAVLAVRAGDQLHVFDEVLLSDAGTLEMAAHLAARFSGRELTVYPDPSGRARRTSAPVGQTDFSLLRGQGFSVVAPRKAPPVVDRINLVNQLCMPGQGTPRLLVNPQCRHLVTGMRELAYRPGTSSVDKGSGHDHITDALGYLAWGEFPLSPAAWPA